MHDFGGHAFLAARLEANLAIEERRVVYNSEDVRREAKNLKMTGLYDKPGLVDMTVTILYIQY